MTAQSAIRFIIILGCFGWLIGTQSAHTDRLKQIEAATAFCVKP